MVDRVMKCSQCGHDFLSEGEKSCYYCRTGTKRKEQVYNEVYMNVAQEFASLSHAVRKKVGSIIVKDGNIISIGWNGTPSGFDNNCEYEVDGTLKTKDEVIHAEANAILKLSRSTMSSENSALYVTLSPCIECSKMILQAKIKEVYYKESYKGDPGVEFLRKAGIKVQQIVE